jgi:hypothetical protein
VPSTQVAVTLNAAVRLPAMEKALKTALLFQGTVTA